MVAEGVGRSKGMTPEEAIKQLEDLQGYVFSETGHLPNDEDEIAISVLIEAFKKIQWIPCSERLPEDGQTVLIQYEDRKNERKTMAVGWMENDYLCCWDDRITHAIDNAVAWMPLPEPYEKEGAGNEE